MLSVRLCSFSLLRTATKSRLLTLSLRAKSPLDVIKSGLVRGRNEAKTCLGGRLTRLTLSLGFVGVSPLAVAAKSGKDKSVTFAKLQYYCCIINSYQLQGFGEKCLFYRSGQDHDRRVQVRLGTVSQALGAASRIPLSRHCRCPGGRRAQYQGE